MLSLVNIRRFGKMIKQNRTFTHEDAQIFGTLVNDHNKIHFDEEYAKTTIFGQRIVHGMLLGGFISGILANEFPKAVYKSQNYKFIRPVYFNEEIQARLVIISSLEKEKGTEMKLETNIYKKNETGEHSVLIIKGEAEILVLK